MSDGYYQFSGWNKEDFNVTEDTTISGSWSEKKTMDLSWGKILLQMQQLDGMLAVMEMENM